MSTSDTSPAGTTILAPGERSPGTSATPPTFVSPYQRQSQERVAALKRAARELAEIAQTVKAVSERATTAVAEPSLRISIARLATRRRLLRALVDSRGLGFGFAGGRFGRLAEHFGTVLGRENLFTAIMASSLRLRLEALLLAHPELVDDRKLARIVGAVCQDRDLEAMIALRVLFRERGVIGALSRLAPAMLELFALKALQDENPLNDAAAWQVATEQAPPRTDLLIGLPAAILSFWDPDKCGASPVEPSFYEGGALHTRGGLLNFLGNIELLGNDGRVLIQTVKGPDLAERFVLQAPGARPGEAWNTTPQDLAGAVRAVQTGRCGYLGAVKSALDQCGIAPGSEVAVVGHSMGGIVGMLLAEDEEFCERYRLTHVVAIGSPIRNRRPVDARTEVVSITNQHDIFTVLDGIGPGSCSPGPNGWYIIDYTLPTHQFPECHSPAHYGHDLEHLLTECTEYIDDRMWAYRGPVLRSQLFQTYDRIPGQRPPS